MYRSEGYDCATCPFSEIQNAVISGVAGSSTGIRRVQERCDFAAQELEREVGVATPCGLAASAVIAMTSMQLMTDNQETGNN